MRFAHSLGYPHYELMLAGMSRTQYQELLVYFQLEHEAREERESALAEASVMHRLAVVQARQQREKNG
jgi:hypothetical protein